MRTVEVLATGAQTLVEDLGRPGYAHLGVPPSGALDVASLRLANRLAGNPETAAGLENLLGGLSLRFAATATVAVTGPAVTVSVDGRPRGSHVPLAIRAGQELTLGTPSRGLRCYVGISGGIAAAESLGSRSSDVLSGIGPRPLRAGDELPLGRACGVPSGADVVVPVAAPDTLVVPATPGPRDDWLADAATGLSGWWTVTAESNRVGLRLDGTPLRRVVTAELPSEGVVTGAVQVPPNGRPVVFLADHPTTGGYPVAAVVARMALGALAQARPGTRLRFRLR